MVAEAWLKIETIFGPSILKLEREQIDKTGHNAFGHFGQF